jgi:hypothetical protein
MDTYEMTPEEIKAEDDRIKAKHLLKDAKDAIKVLNAEGLDEIIKFCATIKQQR